MAEHMLTTTLMAMKRMPEYLHMQDRKDWKLLTDITHFVGSKVLSVGMGGIGTALYWFDDSHSGFNSGSCLTAMRTREQEPDCFIRDFINFYDGDALTEIVHGMR